MCITSLLLIAGLIYLGYLLMNNRLPFNIGGRSKKYEYTDKDVEYWRKRNERDKETNRILDKINRIGIDKLTEKEKQFLKDIRK